MTKNYKKTPTQIGQTELDAATLEWVDAQLEVLQTIKMLQEHDSVRRSGLKSAREHLRSMADMEARVRHGDPP